MRKLLFIILPLLLVSCLNESDDEKAKKLIKEYYLKDNIIRESNIIEYSQLFPEGYDCSENTEATTLSLQIAVFNYAVSINPNVSEQAITEYKEKKRMLDEIALKYSLPITKYSMFCIYSLDGINKKGNRFIFNKDITNIEMVH